MKVNYISVCRTIAMQSATAINRLVRCNTSEIFIKLTVYNGAEDPDMSRDTSAVRPQSNSSINSYPLALHCG